MKVTKFFNHTDPDTGWLSNFYPSPFIDFLSPDGMEYPTVEHYYQAVRMQTETDRIAVAKMKTPREAKDYARKHNPEMDIECRVSFMRLGLALKFSIPEFRDKLEATQGVIVEDSPTDSFWGIGRLRGGDGVNMLGLLLMERRELLRAGR